jgi:hypothetical protein
MGDAVTEHLRAVIPFFGPPDLDGIVPTALDQVARDPQPPRVVAEDRDLGVEDRAIPDRPATAFEVEGDACRIRDFDLGYAQRVDVGEAGQWPGGPGLPFEREPLHGHVARALGREQRLKAGLN